MATSWLTSQMHVVTEGDKGQAETGRPGCELVIKPPPNIQRCLTYTTSPKRMSHGIFFESMSQARVILQNLIYLYIQNNHHMFSVC